MDTEKPKEEKGGFTLLPPAPNVCQECAVDHGLKDAHDALSLYYQMHFRSKHGRWPTWKDAIAHCDPDVRKQWEEELKKMGVWTEPESTVPDVCPMDDNRIGTTTIIPIDHGRKKSRGRK